MKIRIDVSNSFDAAGDAWAEFEERGGLYVFQTRAWLENWYDTIGGGLSIEPCFVSVFAGDVPAFFFPLQVDTGGAIREIRWFGDDMIDYGAPVVGPADGIVFADVWKDVLRRLPDADLVRLSKIPETIRGVSNPLCRLKCRKYHSSAHFVELDGGWEDFYERHTGAKTRSTDRRKQRRLSEMGTLEFRVTDGRDGAALAEITEQMIGQKIERYRNIRAPNVMARDGVPDFFARPTATLRESGFLHVSALELDGAVITTHWGMRHGDRFYYYMPSFADGPWMRYSPGRILLFELYRWCFQNDVKVFDFTIGDEPYKKDWCDRELPLYHYFEALTGRGRIACIGRSTAAALLANPTVLTLARNIRRWFH